MEWEYSQLETERTEEYDTGLKRHIKPLHLKQKNSGAGSAISGSSISTDSVADSSTAAATRASSSSDDFHLPIGPSESRASIHPKRSLSPPKPGEAQKLPIQKTRVVKNERIKAAKQEPMEKLGIYGAEMLRCSLGRRHAFGLLVIHAVFWVWWFDRQGAIQSTGIDFIENLPRLLVFLTAIQRFTIADWGFDAELDSRFSKISDQSSDFRNVELVINEKLKIEYNPCMNTLLYDAFCLNGRSTNVFGVENRTECLPLVAKLYWPDSTKLDEATIIAEAYTRVPHISNHLPRVIRSRVVDPVGTDRIRRQLGISLNSPRPPRVLCIIIFERLEPITQLTGNLFLIAWVQCMRFAWKNDIRHQDLSLGNLMIRTFKDGRFYGVVNDWGLSYVRGKSPPCSDVTVTVPFMALDLVPLDQSTTASKRAYYCDLESFAWIILWTFLAVKNKEVQPGEELAMWSGGNPNSSVGYRRNLLAKLRAQDRYSLGEWQENLPLAQGIAKWLCRSFEPEDGETNEENKELILGFLRVVEESGGIISEEPEIDDP
ncbi:unnamed protein product [Rhizoctonia solani]|uniref:Fungal-type protein kinase domain-containing protein n=1 Tax=Rhizoctonia solani TaxID=456999 RepID=A0A8H2ZWL0_9AGAM|nr:unnamed protein product [Rhizoctonia solani]